MESKHTNCPDPRQGIKTTRADRPHYDSLTGLPDKTLFFNHLTHAVMEAHRKKHVVAVLFLCLNNLKLINDTLGRRTGDILLKAVAENIRNCLRASDTLARPGRDEFMLLLPEIATAEDAKLVSEKISSILNTPFLLEKHELFVTFNMGISLYPNDSKDAETLIKNSYTAMCNAKEQGENICTFYSQELNNIAFERLALETNLRLALRRNEFLLHYQPLIDLNTGKIVSIEALVRWQHPELGLIFPTEFVTLAEKNGLIIPIGDWVLYSSCKQAKAWETAGFTPLRIAVNLSARQFHQQNLLKKIEDILNETSLNPDCLELELTESILIQNEEKTAATLLSLRKMGIHISIDDFGTGYSSLYYLKRLPINSLKIAQSFISSVPTDPDDTAITRAIIAMAHSLNLNVIAEGVHKEEQLEFLRLLKCDKAQGYLFSQPLPAEELTKLLIKENNKTIKLGAEGGI